MNIFSIFRSNNVPNLDPVLADLAEVKVLVGNLATVVAELRTQLASQSNLDQVAAAVSEIKVALQGISMTAETG